MADSYTREDDGVEMVEFDPHQYVNRKYLELALRSLLRRANPEKDSYDDWS